MSTRVSCRLLWILCTLSPASPLIAGTCESSSTTLCLQDGRFAVALEARSHLGVHQGIAVPYTDRDGAFYFFAAGNLELMVKMIDGRGYNGAYWVFYGPLTGLEFDLTVRDTVSGTERTYHQREGDALSRYDTLAFPVSPPPPAAPTPIEGRGPAAGSGTEATAAVSGDCVEDAMTLCLTGGRLRATLQWRGIDGTEPRQSVPARKLGTDSGAFWFFEPTNPEVLVKTHDGRTHNRAFWVFSASLTNIDYELVLEDTASGRRRVYPHAGSERRSLIDTSAFRESDSAPLTPRIVEPDRDDRVVSGFDVRFITDPMVDPDAGDEHYCSDFEIWTTNTEVPPQPTERIWFADCVTGPARTFARTRDGVWEGSRAIQRFLEFGPTYRLRARHRDSTGRSGPWAERRFSTGILSRVFPMQRERISEGATWMSESGQPVELPVGSGVHLEIATAPGIPLITWRPKPGPGNRVYPGLTLAREEPIAITVSNPGPSALSFPPSVIHLDESESAISRTIYLPSLEVPPVDGRRYWVSENGSTFTAAFGEPSPRFETVARYTPRPWRSLVPGIEIEKVSDGLHLPVKLAAVANPGPSPTAPLLYATELVGSVALIRRDGVRETFVEGLLDFDPLGDFPGAGGLGLTGLAIEPSSGDLFVTLVYPVDTPIYPTVFSARVLRLGVDASGRHDGRVETVLDLAPEVMGSGHQIADLIFDPQGQLFVHQADGFHAAKAHDLDSFLGKVLKLDPRTGTPAPDNPFYDLGDGISPRDYVYAYGFRNPFGGTWSTERTALFAVENGPTVDRLARIDRGLGYGWDADQDGVGHDADMLRHAIYNWGSPPHAPTEILFLEPGVFGGSGFPSEFQGLALVSEFGQPFVPGPSETGKRISAIRLSPNGSLVAGPDAWVEYTGHARSTLVAMASGPDGIYFAEFFPDIPGSVDPGAPGARVWRLSWIGPEAP